MTQNPFDALGGGGGFDMNALLQQAQQMQEQLQNAQARLAETEVDGTVAGGAVTVTSTASASCVGVEIKAGELRRPRRRRPLRPRRHDRGRLPRRQGPGRRARQRGTRPARRWRRRCPALPGSARRTSLYEGIVQDLIDELGRLPGVGPKSAQRIAFHLLQADPADVRRLADVLIEVKAKVKFCSICFNVSEDEQCRICRDPRRDPAAAVRRRGVQGRRRDRADPRVPRPLPRARRRDLADRRHRPRPAADPRADDPAGRRHRHRGDPGHRPQPRGRGDRDLPHPDAQATWGCA